MTDKTRQDSGSTHIIRYALELGLLWVDGDGRDKVREALDALDTLEAQLESIGAGGVQALSAAPAGFVPVAAFDRLHAHAESLAARLLAASPTPPAEQQAPKETLGGVNGWRDISTAPKDGSRFVAIGYNYGLYSEGRHICVAQWFRGCWMETSDWNEASELKHLTHWLPLPSPPDDVAAPAEQQAAPKAVPGESEDSDGFGSAEHWKEKAQYWAGVAHRLRGEALRGEPVDGIVHPPAPQQEAQEPCGWTTGITWRPNTRLQSEQVIKITRDTQPKYGYTTPIYTAPQPAPLSDDVVRDAARYRWLRATTNYATSNGERIDVRNMPETWDVAIDAALAAQGGKV